MKYPPLFKNCQIAFAAMVFTAGWAFAQGGGDTLAYWRFEGAPGSDFAQAKSEVGDCVMTGQAGSKAAEGVHPAYGEPAPDSGDKSSLSLNNKAATNNDGVFAITDTLREIKGTVGVTVEAWVKPATIRESVIIRSVEKSGDMQFQLALKQDGSVCFLVNQGGIDYAVVSQPGSLSENEWHHLAAVFGADGPCFYIDGRLAAARKKGIMQWPEISGSFGRLGIGAYVRNGSATNVGLFFDGQIDGVRITGKALEPVDFLGGRKR